MAVASMFSLSLSPTWRRWTWEPSETRQSLQVLTLPNNLVHKEFVLGRAFKGFVGTKSSLTSHVCNLRVVSKMMLTQHVKDCHMRSLRRNNTQQLDQHNYKKVTLTL